MKTRAYKPTATVKLGVSRQVVIPKQLHDRLGLKPGDFLEVEEREGKVVMTPKTLVDRRIQVAFEESMHDFKAGQYSGPFDTADEAIQSLQKTVRVHRPRKSKRR
jgi:AbrB family looped-hinge helix DNA binding protein